MVTKFKIGQRVRVRSDLIAKSYFGKIWVNPAMIQFCGKVYTISDVRIIQDNIVYHFNEIPLSWEENMLCCNIINLAFYV